MSAYTTRPSAPRSPQHADHDTDAGLAYGVKASQHVTDLSNINRTGHGLGFTTTSFGWCRWYFLGGNL